MVVTQVIPDILALNASAQSAQSLQCGEFLCVMCGLVEWNPGMVDVELRWRNFGSQNCGQGNEIELSLDPNLVAYYSLLLLDRQ